MKTLPEDIQNLIKKKDLELIEIMQRPDSNRRRFFSLHVQERDENKRDLVLKIFGQGDPSVVSGFEKEVQFLHKVTQENNALSRYVPKLRDKGNGERPWCLREYADQYIGDICVDFGIKEEFLTSGLKDDFLDFFPALCKFSVNVGEDKKFSTLSTHDSEWYRKDFGFYKKHVKCIPAEVFERVEEILKDKEPLLDETVACLVHGDLYPKNIFWSSGLKVSDWELLHWGTPVFDPCFVWALAWKDADWQAGFLESFREDLKEGGPDSEALMDVAQLVVLLRFIRHSEIMLKKVLPEDAKEARDNAKRALEAHKKQLEKIIDI